MKSNSLARTDEMENEPRQAIVFIVDDSVTMRTMLNKVLAQTGFIIYESGSGEEVIELLKMTDPDAILLDVEMPGMGGFATCEQIRSMPNGKNVPIMMVTSLEDLESINKAYKAGATDFTTKPINWDIIGHRVKYMIRTNENYLELQRTKRKLDQLNLDLEERVILRTTQLKTVNQNLKNMLDELRSTQEQLVESEKLASLGNLVAGVAHEVNTPIGIAITSISMLNNNINQFDERYSKNQLKRSDLVQFISSAKEASTLIEGNLNRAIELIKSFKLVSADQISEDKRTINLSTYLEEIMRSLKPALNKTRLTTKISCPNDLEVYIHPGAVFQILTIFVMNSITHGYNSEEVGTLGIDVNVLDDHVELIYSDTGKGIAPDIIGKIFDPFFTTKRNTGCIGLGLNIAYNTVTKVLNGTLKCESTLGQGVKFIIKFPINKENGKIQF